MIITIITILFCCLCCVLPAPIFATDFNHPIWGSSSEKNPNCAVAFDTAHSSPKNTKSFQWSLKGMFAVTVLFLIPISIINSVVKDKIRTSNEIRRTFEMDQFLESGTYENLRNALALTSPSEMNYEYIAAITKLVRDAKHEEFIDFVNLCEDKGWGTDSWLWTRVFEEVAYIPNRTPYLEFLWSQFEIDTRRLPRTLLPIMINNDRKAFEFVLARIALDGDQIAESVKAGYENKVNRFFLDRLFNEFDIRTTKQSWRQTELLEAAIAAGNESDFLYFIEKGIDPLKLNDRRLDKLATLNLNNVTAFLLHEGAIDQENQRILMQKSAYAHSFDTLDVLISHQIKNKIDFNINNFMIHLFSHGKNCDLKILKHLVKNYSADISYDHDRLLILSIKHGNSAMVEWLLANGAHIDEALKKSVY